MAGAEITEWIYLIFSNIFPIEKKCCWLLVHVFVCVSAWMTGVIGIFSSFHLFVSALFSYSLPHYSLVFSFQTLENVATWFSSFVCEYVCEAYVDNVLYKLVSNIGRNGQHKNSVTIKMAMVLMTTTTVLSLGHAINQKEISLQKPWRKVIHLAKVIRSAFKIGIYTSRGKK